MQVGQGMSGCRRPSFLGALLCGAGSTSGVRGCCLRFTSALWAAPPEFPTRFWLQGVECEVPVSLGVPYPEEPPPVKALRRDGIFSPISSESSAKVMAAGRPGLKVLMAFCIVGAFCLSRFNQEPLRGKEQASYEFDARGSNEEAKPEIMNADVRHEKREAAYAADERKRPRNHYKCAVTQPHRLVKPQSRKCGQRESKNCSYSKSARDGQ
jgi:hypothetical protein